MRKKYIFFILFLMCAIIVLTIGCGGGGGSGRQVLPGENPTGPISPGPGTGSGTGPGTGTDPGTGNSPTVSQKLENGWSAMNYGNWSGAILYFDSVISDNNATAEQRQQAYNGRGWAKTKNYGISSGMSDFILARNLPESLLGYAMSLVQQGTNSSIRQAVEIFEQIGLGDPNYKLTLEHASIGVSSAEAHAMTAYAYFWRGDPGDDDKARAQILAARSADSSSTSSVAQIYNTLKKAGLTGI